jgi:hypothetical protein
MDLRGARIQTGTNLLPGSGSSLSYRAADAVGAGGVGAIAGNTSVHFARTRHGGLSPRNPAKATVTNNAFLKTGAFGLAGIGMNAEYL